ncbi:MAG: divergent polysaccharide deacetylase family protein [Alphaproteobacteria bacterium]|nr:divergent polysaccharide deacetylase family protein [Alphaproteobacteria bacterium]
MNYLLIATTLVALVAVYLTGQPEEPYSIRGAVAQVSDGETTGNLRLLAHRGDATAQYKLGLRYKDGRGVGVNHEQSAKWFRLAAEQGENEAQNSLAWAYATGKGVSQNYIEAYKWSMLAYNRNVEILLVERHHIVDHMSEDQIAEAERLARVWQPKSAEMASLQLREETKRVAVGEAQKLLGILDYRIGDTEGVAGPRTRAAIKAFQFDDGMATTGEVSRELLARLRNRVQSGRNDPALPVIVRGNYAKAERIDPDVRISGTQAWRKYAVAAAVPDGRPMIAVVIDDVGLDRRRSRRAMALPAPVTIALMAYAADAQGQAAMARRGGHELLVHLPMEAENKNKYPGPNTLRSDLSAAEFARRLEWHLTQFTGFVGVNNHMGSKLTSDPVALAPVMAALKQRGLIFLDSLTSGRAKGVAVARQFGVPSVERSVFLDHDVSTIPVHTALARTEALAQQNGFAIAIGHPRDVTLDALEEWLPDVKKRGFMVVPLTTIVRHVTSDRWTRNQEATRTSR